jgi:CRP-like cAMP-binding protein
VVDGLVGVERAASQPLQIHAGGTVGFLELLARLERGVTARALTNTLTIELGWDAQLEVCEQYFSVLHAYVRFLARQLVSQMKRSGAPFGAAKHEIGPGQDAGRQLDLVDRVLALAAAESFAPRNMDAIVELARHVDEVRYEPARTLWKRGDEAQEFVLITSGTVQCSRKREHEWSAGFRIALGMHEALAGRARWYDAESVTPVTGLRIHIEPFLDMLEDHFELAVDVMGRMAAQVLELSDRWPEP